MTGSDEIYWRRRFGGDPNVEIIEPENLWFYPGEGLCVDGYYYWASKKWVKRLPREIWIQYGRRRRHPPMEKPQKDVYQTVLRPGVEQEKKEARAP